MALIPLLFNIALKDLDRAIKKGKEKTSKLERSKIICLQMTHKNLLELIHKFNKIAGNKINTQKSAAFLHTNNEQSKKGIKKNLIA